MKRGGSTCRSTPSPGAPTRRTSASPRGTRRTGPRACRGRCTRWVVCGADRGGWGTGVVEEKKGGGGELGACSQSQINLIAHKTLNLMSCQVGHALYEQGRSDAHRDLPVSHALSMGAHESQSLIWERCVLAAAAALVAAARGLLCVCLVFAAALDCTTRSRHFP